MKEYINKTTGEYRKTTDVVSGDQWIEVPSGANIYALAGDGLKTFWSDEYQWLDGEITRYIKKEDPKYTFKEWALEWNASILWQRSPSREYINKTTGEYRKTSEAVSGEQWIEVPEGAECLTKCIDRNNDTWFLFWKGNYKICVGNDDDWYDFESDVKEYLSSWSSRAHILWQRPAQPEALPFVDDDFIVKDNKALFDKIRSGAIQVKFVDDEPSLNDQYAEIEQVRQAQRENNHYFINVSDVDEVDFYEIAKRYNVADPAIQHILKKCLAIGNRGHKDLETDLRDILKSAKRALEINGFSL